MFTACTTSTSHPVLVVADKDTYTQFKLFLIQHPHPHHIWVVAPKTSAPHLGSCPYNTCTPSGLLPTHLHPSYLGCYSHNTCTSFGLLLTTPALHLGCCPHNTCTKSYLAVALTPTHHLGCCSYICTSFQLLLMQHMHLILLWLLPISHLHTIWVAVHAYRLEITVPVGWALNINN